VWTVNGFSAHADQPALISWLSKTEAKQVFLVHGEKDTLPVFEQAIRNKISSIETHKPAWKERVTL